MDNGSVVGFNSPRQFAEANGSIFIPSANGIVITSNEESTFWQPGDESYQVDKIAVNPDGTVLCFTEKRLSVSLHFFSTNSNLKHINDVKEIASVEVEQLLFSDNGEYLFVLITVPTNCVRVLTRSGVKFTPTYSVVLPEGRIHSLFSTGCSADENAFAVLGDTGCFSYRLGDDYTYNQYFALTIENATLLCGTGSENGLVFGTSRGEVIHCRACDSASKRVVATADSSAGINALVSLGSGMYHVGTQSGDIFAINLLAPSMGTALCNVGSPISRLMCSKDTDHHVYVGSEAGIYLYDFGSAECVVLPVKRRLPQVVKCFSLPNNQLLVACADGSFAVYSGMTISMHTCSVELTVLDCCVATAQVLVLVCVDGTVRGYNVLTGRQLWVLDCGKALPSMSYSDGKGRIVVCDEHNVFFFRCTKGDNSCVSNGVMRAHDGSPITMIRWFLDEDLFFVGCQNGELYLVRFPHEDQEAASGSDFEHAVEDLVESAWRLDMPIIELLPCYSDGSVLHLFVHSVDKDTKLYALERRREGEKKVIRPLFLMRDHDSGGGCLVRLDASTALSGGKDGHVVLRDIAHYQAKLTAIPPSKEKRKPLLTIVAKPFCNGGVSTVALWGGMLVVGGNDCVLLITSLATSEQLRWREPTWNVRHIVGQRKSACDGAALASVEEFKPAVASLSSDLGQLRCEWRELMSEKEDDVPVESLLLPDEQAKFATECDEAIFKMREEEYYHRLMNEYVQHTIKRNCVATMQVNLSKIVCLQEKDGVVHNFHLLKATCAQQPLFRKAQFLRRLQKAAAKGHRFAPLREESYATQVSHDAELANELKPLTALMYSPYDVYTHTRAALQSLLYKNVILAAKESFNRRFNELRERKRSAISQIEERTQRCIQIMKQLGEAPGELFTVLVDKEEDSKALFNVYDDELEEEVRKLIVRDTGVKVYSPSNEAALKQWMDGLERDVELLEVKLLPPEFVDESRPDSFVPPDERTEEQMRVVEEYEKRLGEETEKVNTRREALRNEFHALQKENKRGAVAIDESLKQLRWVRLATSETVDEAGLQLVSLLKHLLRTPAAFRVYTALNEQIKSIRQHLGHASALLELKHAAASAAVSRVDELEEECTSYLSRFRDVEPFLDSECGEKLYRRFTRWKNRYEEGKAPLPSVDKPADDFSPELWLQYCEHCKRVATLRRDIASAEEQQQRDMEGVALVEQECDALRERIAAAESEKDQLKSNYITSLLNTESLYRMHQGQVQDERTIATSDFATSCMRWVEDADQYNQLILASDGENVQLLGKIIQRQKRMKLLQWETERLHYCAGTLQMELRQLHTLRVTRQMQEWLSGDSEMSEEKAIMLIERHMDYISQNMTRKIQELGAVARRLKGQIAERCTENAIFDSQCQQLTSSVQDTMSVKELVDTHADGSLHFIKRAKEIYETSDLEELARSQQEELFRLKKEADRLRERTFPSFAVVSKRTV